MTSFEVDPEAVHKFADLLSAHSSDTKKISSFMTSKSDTTRHSKGILNSFAIGHAFAGVADTFRAALRGGARRGFSGWPVGEAGARYVGQRSP